MRGKRNDEEDFATLNIIVEHKHRGKGYANDMMQHMIDEYDALHLYVDKDNYKAINLYKKLGFKEYSILYQKKI